MSSSRCLFKGLWKLMKTRFMKGSGNIGSDMAEGNKSGPMALLH